MILTKISKSNRSLIITIPRELVKQLNLKQKDYLSVAIDAENKLTFQKVRVTPSQVFIDDENVTEQTGEPFVDLNVNESPDPDKKNW